MRTWTVLLLLAALPLAAEPKVQTEQDGLEVALSVAKPKLGRNEPWIFTVRYTNRSGAVFKLYEPAYWPQQAPSYHFRIEEPATGKVRTLAPMTMRTNVHKVPMPTVIAAGASFESRLTFGQHSRWVVRGERPRPNTGPTATGRPVKPEPAPKVPDQATDEPAQGAPVPKVKLQLPDNILPRGAGDPLPPGTYRLHLKLRFFEAPPSAVRLPANEEAQDVDYWKGTIELPPLEFVIAEEEYTIDPLFGAQSDLVILGQLASLNMRQGVMEGKLRVVKLLQGEGVKEGDILPLRGQAARLRLVQTSPLYLVRNDDDTYQFLPASMPSQPPR